MWTNVKAGGPEIVAIRLRFYGSPRTGRLATTVAEGGEFRKP